MKKWKEQCCPAPTCAPAPTCNWRPSNKKCRSHKLPVSIKQLLKFLIRIRNTG